MMDPRDRGRRLFDTQTGIGFAENINYNAVNNSFSGNSTCSEVWSNYTEEDESSLPSEEDIQKAGLREKFHIIKTIGSGAYGMVYLVTNKTDEHNYALKVIKHNGEKALREAKCLAKLNKQHHPNILRYNFSDNLKLNLQTDSSFDTSLSDNDNNNSLTTPKNDNDDDDGIVFGNSEGDILGNSNSNSGTCSSSEGSLSVEGNQLLWILMELCDHTLKDFIDNKKVNDVALANQLSQNITEGLKYTHELGIMHRDLNPNNIFICTPSSGTVVAKIGDFGSCRESYLDYGERKQSNKLTDYIGTKAYCAPEVETGKYNKKCDHYSLGMIFFAVWYKPLHDMALQEKEPLMKGIRSQDVKLPPDIHEHVDHRIVELIQSLLQHNPEDRLDLAQVLEQLKDFDMQDEASGGTFTKQDIHVHKKKENTVEEIEELATKLSQSQLKDGTVLMNFQQDMMKLQQEYLDNAERSDEEYKKANLQKQRENMEKQKEYIRQTDQLSGNINNQPKSGYVHACQYEADIDLEVGKPKQLHIQPSQQ